MDTFPINLGHGHTIEIESLVQIKQAILPASMTRVRPGMPIVPRFWCQHENGNPDHDANDERRYFHDGAEGRQASYHFVGDSEIIYQLLPLDENGWHAGDNLGPGNMASIAGAIAQGARSTTSARHAMEHLAAGVMTALGIPPANTRQHHDFAPDLKNCPQWIRRDGYWPTFQQNVARLMTNVAGSAAPSTVQSFATPIQIARLDVTQGIAPGMVVLDDGTECIWVGDRVRAVRATPRLQWASQSAPRIGVDIDAGTEFDVNWLLQNGEGWWYYTPYDTRVKFDDCERVSDTKAA